MTKNTETRKPRLHTTISEETESLIEKYASLKDVNGDIFYGNKSRVVEKAIELLDKYHNPEKGELESIWNRAREEVNMTLISKHMFLSFMKGDYKSTINENMAIDIIEWYKGQYIEDIPTKELLEAIKNIWLAANYFTRISITEEGKYEFQISFYHDYNNRDYSDFWGKYFTMLFLKRKEYDVEYFTRISSLLLKIKEISTQEERSSYVAKVPIFGKKRSTPFFDKNENLVGYLVHEFDDSDSYRYKPGPKKK